MNESTPTQAPQVVSQQEQLFNPDPEAMKLTEAVAVYQQIAQGLENGDIVINGENGTNEQPVVLSDQEKETYETLLWGLQNSNGAAPEDMTELLPKRDWS